MSLQKPGLGSTYVARVEQVPLDQKTETCSEARKLLAFVGRFHKWCL